MFNRFRRIRSEFGTIMFARTILLLAVIVGISVFELVGFTSLWPTVVAIVGLAVGVLFRRAIVDSFEYSLGHCQRACLFMEWFCLLVTACLGCRVNCNC